VSAERLVAACLVGAGVVVQIAESGLFNALFFGGIALSESAMQQVLQITL
jgi:hypothetical protein